MATITKQHEAFESHEQMCTSLGLFGPFSIHKVEGSNTSINHYKCQSSDGGFFAFGSTRLRVIYKLDDVFLPTKGSTRAIIVIPSYNKLTLPGDLESPVSKEIVNMASANGLGIVVVGMPSLKAEIERQHKKPTNLKR